VGEGSGAAPEEEADMISPEEEAEEASGGEA